MPKPTLYQRMGADARMKIIVTRFYEEILHDATLQPMFADISVAALQVHQIKLFRVLYGPDAEKPDHTEYLDFMLATHTRLFRDHGLNVQHFDAVAVCLQKALRALQYTADLIDECITELVPLRIVFEHGARVAQREKQYTAEQWRTLPTTTAASLLDANHEVLTVLPNPAGIDVPDWLSTDYLERYSQQGSVRAWTKELIDRFTADPVIADTFLDAPYMNHHVFAAALLQLAFLDPQQQHTNDKADDNTNIVPDLMDVIQKPRGPTKGRLWHVLWERMTQEFRHVCQHMHMDANVMEQAIANLQSYNHFFRQGEVRLVGGVHSPHILRRQTPKGKVSKLSSNGRHRPSAKAVDIAVTDSESSGDSSSDSHHHPGNGIPTSITIQIGGTQRKGVWRRLFGWTKA
eukprot:scaffold12005_cov212-Amphora_coffeaeformis.AAC.2